MNILALYAQPQGIFKLRFLLEDLAGDDTSAQNAILEGLHYGNEQLMVLQDGDDQRLVEIINVSQAFGVQTNYFHNIILTLRERDIASLLVRFNTVINKHVGYSVSLPEFGDDGTTAITGHLLEYKLQTETTWTRGAVQAGTGMQSATIELPTEDLYDVRAIARSASQDEQVGLQRCVLVVNYQVQTGINTPTRSQVIVWPYLDSGVPLVYRQAETSNIPVVEWQNLVMHDSIVTDTNAIIYRDPNTNTAWRGFTRYSSPVALTDVPTADAMRCRSPVTGYVTYWSPWMTYDEMVLYAHN